MTTDELINAIRTATGGTYEMGVVRSTLMGWVPKFDKLGRPLNADPNIKTSFISIDGETYMMRKSGWKVNIYESDQTTKIATIDLTPDYLKMNKFNSL